MFNAREYFFWKPYLETLASARFSSNFACASHFFVHFFAITARLRCETALFHVLWKVKTQDNNFLFLVFKIANILDKLNEMEYCKCDKFKAAQFTF